MVMGRVGVKSSKGASAGNRTQRSGYCDEGLIPRGLRLAAERRAEQFTDRYHSQRITGESGGRAERIRKLRLRMAVETGSIYPNDRSVVKDSLTPPTREAHSYPVSPPVGARSSRVA